MDYRRICVLYRSYRKYRSNLRTNIMCCSKTSKPVVFPHHQHLIRKENPKDNKIILFIRVTAFNFPLNFPWPNWKLLEYLKESMFFSFRYGIDNLSVTRGHKLFVSFINFRVRLEHLSSAHACYGSWRARLWCSRRDYQGLGILIFMLLRASCQV